tara:strand:- start:346 stop:645 length:300 start_codon:yes stop_codon:yes gene_type:complete
MSQYRESSGSSFGSLLSGAILGAAGLAWWLLSEAERRQESRKQRAMLYTSRIQDGSEAAEITIPSQEKKSNDNLEQRVEQLNAAIADVRKQLEDLGQAN